MEKDEIEKKPYKKGQLAFILKKLVELRKKEDLAPASSHHRVADYVLIVVEDVDFSDIERDENSWREKMCQESSESRECQRRLNKSEEKRSQSQGAHNLGIERGDIASLEIFSVCLDYSMN